MNKEKIVVTYDETVNDPNSVDFGFMIRKTVKFTNVVEATEAIKKLVANNTSIVGQPVIEIK